jgi:hypothetical protein
VVAWHASYLRLQTHYSRLSARRGNNGFQWTVIRWVLCWTRPIQHDLHFTWNCNRILYQFLRNREESVLEMWLNIQCVHKALSGFWKIVTRKQIQLTTCGLRRVDFVGLRTNDARTVSTHSSLTPGLPLLLRSWTLPVSRKRRCQSLIA